MKRKRVVLTVMLAGVLLFFLLGLDTRLVVRKYRIESDKLTEPVRVVFLSDLHSCEHGAGQGMLLELVRKQAPDYILLGGDWVDDDFGHRPPGLAYKAARALGEMCPTFYVSGNHELWSGYGDELKQEIAECGVTVLEGEEVLLPGGLRIFGIDDPAAGEELWRAQLAEGKRGLSEVNFSLLLTHRPERVEEYDGFDLVLAGHAHGGQWRLPGVVNGLFAPDQGWFPAYAGGEYRLADGSVMIVGRGLSKESTRVPRFFDRPEVVVVDLAPARSFS